MKKELIISNLLGFIFLQILHIHYGIDFKETPRNDFDLIMMLSSFQRRFEQIFQGQDLEFAYLAQCFFRSVHT